jgi:hypothetical protein
MKVNLFGDLFSSRKAIEAKDFFENLLDCTATAV